MGERRGVNCEVSMRAFGLGRFGVMPLRGWSGRRRGARARAASWRLAWGGALMECRKMTVLILSDETVACVSVD